MNNTTNIIIIIIKETILPVFAPKSFLNFNPKILDGIKNIRE